MFTFGRSRIRWHRHNSDACDERSDYRQDGLCRGSRQHRNTLGLRNPLCHRRGSAENMAARENRIPDGDRVVDVVAAGDGKGIQ